jgi:GR25 family glycosyltransferase involved in LPS biosynthesis
MKEIDIETAYDMLEEKVDLYTLLKNKFDIIYVLSMSDRKDRRNSIENQFFVLLACEPEQNNIIRYFYGTKFKYNNIIADSFNRTGTGRFTKPNEYDCARNHYSMVKICYDLGYEHCLIMEDDILFMTDYEKIKEYMNTIPDDYDILQFGGFTTDTRILKYTEEGNENWVKHEDVGVWNCSMYALSRKGMEYYLAFMDKIFWVADGPLYKAPLNKKLVNTYISREPVVIQADKEDSESDIRNSENDSINYKNDNIYEKNIDRNKYFKYYNK